MKIEDDLDQGTNDSSQYFEEDDFEEDDFEEDDDNDSLCLACDGKLNSYSILICLSCLDSECEKFAKDGEES